MYRPRYLNVGCISISQLQTPAQIAHQLQRVSELIQRIQHCVMMCSVTMPVSILNQALVRNAVIVILAIQTLKTFTLNIASANRGMVDRPISSRASSVMLPAKMTAMKQRSSLVILVQPAIT
jgi:hypothetical protein